jgi:hypothetical protein
MANTPKGKVRELQRKLYVCAKQSKIRRFHALYDRIYRSDVLWEAWKRVRSNGGAAGVDAETISAFSQGRFDLRQKLPIASFFDSLDRLGKRSDALGW